MSKSSNPQFNLNKEVQSPAINTEKKGNMGLKILVAILVIIGLVDFGLSWQGIDITYELVGEFSKFTPWILISIGSYIFSQN